MGEGKDGTKPDGPGPEIVAMLAFDPEARTATCELWLPVEPA